MNTGHAIDPPVHAVPDRPALVVGDTVCTYRELEDTTRRVAAALAAAGVGPGDRVALVDLGSVLPWPPSWRAPASGGERPDERLPHAGRARSAGGLVGATVGVAGADHADRLAAALDGRSWGWRTSPPPTPPGRQPRRGTPTTRRSSVHQRDHRPAQAGVDQPPVLADRWPTTASPSTPGLPRWST